MTAIFPIMIVLHFRGQQLAQQMQESNPDLVEQLRTQMRPPGPESEDGNQQQ